MKYIPVSSIRMKLSKAARKGEVLYIQGGIGIGKTAAVEDYLKRKKAVWFDGESGFLEDIPDRYPAGTDAVVFDNVSCIRDYGSKEYILQVIRRGGCQIILIGRGNLPDWLATVSSQVPFRYAYKEDFVIDRIELEKTVTKEPLCMKEETAERILRVAHDNPLLYVMLSSRIVNGELTDENFERGRLNYYYAMDDRFFSLLDQEERTVMVGLCSFDRFSLEMARRVTANPHIERTFDKLFRHDACLICDGKEYEIPEPYRNYLRWKQTLIMEPYKRSSIFRMAAAYYTEQEDLFTAVSYYRKAGDVDLMAESIIRICDNPDLVIRNLNRINNCLDMLTMEQSLNEPLIMTARSLVYSLEMNHDRSDVWYERLVEYGKRQELGRAERIKIEFYRAYLDLTLPHHSSSRWMERLHRYLDAKKRYNGQKGIPSITLYGYSVLNGLFDFSRLFREEGLKDQLMTAVRQDKHVMSDRTNTIIKLLLQEMALERGEVDEMIFNTQLNKVILEGERREWDDLCLAGIIQYGKLKVIQGDTASTEKIRWDLNKRIRKDTLYAEVIRSINIWISLLKGETKAAEEWMADAPDSREFFSLLDRNNYILKARIEIMKGEYESAQILLTRLGDVYEEYNRDYLWIKGGLLMAVLFHRMGSSRWQECFTATLKRAESFGYIRVIADEGAAVIPLLEDLSQRDKKGYDRGWYDRMEEAVRDMALHYPLYLRENRLEGISLTKTENKVMNYLCRGMKSEEICQHLHISYSGLKYHKRNIYRKLGVSTLKEAVNIAKSIGISQ